MSIRANTRLFRRKVWNRVRKTSLGFRIVKKRDARRRPTSEDPDKAWEIAANKRLRRLNWSPKIAGPVLIERATDLPKLAWSLSIESDGTAICRHGLGVESTQDRIFEGVWQGEFNPFKFEDAGVVFGSGAHFAADKVVLVPPTHMIEPIFLVIDSRTGTGSFSNSLVCALVCAGVEDAPLFHISDRIAAINDDATWRGGYGYDPLLLTEGPYKVLALYMHLFTLDDQGLRVAARGRDDSFSGYDGYVEMMQATMRALVANGTDSARQGSRFDPLVAISRGYDSPACAAIAKAAGCNHSVTLDLTLGDFNDNGASVAEEMGLECTVYPHPLDVALDTLHLSIPPHLQSDADEFLATQGLGDDVILKAFDSDLEDCLLVTGALGDSVWGIETTLHVGIPVRVVYTKSLTEYRLRKGFVQAPLPVIGARFPETIRSMSQSDEMKPWSVGGSYDRPVARRLAEDGGAKRASFGQTKSAVNPNFLGVSAKRRFDAFKRVSERYRSR